MALSFRLSTAGLLLFLRPARGLHARPRAACAAVPARCAPVMLAHTGADRRRAESADALAVLQALLRSGGLSPTSFAMVQLQRALAEGGAVRFRARYEPSGELRVLRPFVARDVTFLAEHFGFHRVLTVETAPATAWADGLAPPRELRVGELEYELVCSKVRKGEPTSWHYVATAGACLPRISLGAELQRVGDFAAITPPSKLAARLELLCSRAGAHSTARMDASMFDVVPDLSPAGALGAAMADGCGFAPEWLVTQLAAQAGALSPEQACALQVRVYSPELGVFKGMLMRRPGLEAVQLTHSMRKVARGNAAAGAAEEPPAAAEGALAQALRSDEALLLVKLVHPTRTNVLRTHPHLQPPPPPQPPAGGAGAGGGGWPHAQAERLPGPPSEMVLRLWAALGLGRATIDAYSARCRRAGSLAELPHASLSGVADPFASLPPGSVFAPGISGSRLFVTRFPCVKPSDGRLLPLVTSRPQSMLQSQWEWLGRLPFGTLVFSVRGQRPLPEICGDGDLDGDLYFACWDEAHVLPGLSERGPSPNPRTLPKPPAPARAPAARAAPIGERLREVHAHLTDPATLHGKWEIGRIFRVWEAVVAQRALGMDDPDALLLADAYLQALDAGKHGGEMHLPPHLRELLAARAPGARPRGGLGLRAAPVGAAAAPPDQGTATAARLDGTTPADAPGDVARTNGGPRWDALPRREGV